jgi:hypothetical protein
MNYPMNKKLAPVIIAIVVLTLLGVFAFAYNKTHQAEQLEDTLNPATSPEDAAFDALDAYLKENISTLSPIKETMGGTFYITRTRAFDNNGTVWYEDGHNAYTATFTYTVDDANVVTIENFAITAE